MQDASNLDKDQKPPSRAMIAAGCSTSATGYGILTVRIARHRRSIRCCPAVSWSITAATPNSLTCAPPTMRWTTATKAEIEDLVCEHSLMFSRGALGFTELSAEERAMFRPVRQRLVRTHPVTGRKSLFLSAHAGSILGWPVPEARAFLRDLVEHATQPRFVYSHKWRQWDLVIWDNRQTMHRVTRFDDTRQVRDMRRTTVAGDAMTVAQAA